MAVTHHATVRNTLATAVLTAIDQDAAAGDLVFLTSGDVVVATLPLAYPAGIVTGPTLDFDCTPPIEDTNAVGGIIAKARVEDNSGDQILYTDNVLTTGGDINLSSLNIAATDTVQVTALSYTAAP